MRKTRKDLKQRFLNDFQLVYCIFEHSWIENSGIVRFVQKEIHMQGKARSQFDRYKLIKLPLLFKGPKPRVSSDRSFKWTRRGSPSTQKRVRSCLPLRRASWRRDHSKWSEATRVAINWSVRSKGVHSGCPSGRRVTTSSMSQKASMPTRANHSRQQSKRRGCDAKSPGSWHRTKPSLSNNLVIGFVSISV